MKIEWLNIYTEFRTWHIVTVHILAATAAAAATAIINIEKLTYNTWNFVK